MRYRDVDYTIAQGQGGQLWKWSFALHDKLQTGEAATKAEAVSEVERAIDRALLVGKSRVV
jgi:macrodomain Ter protein organizer (MatP/YcbG family)